uniref:Uncharacterized protein n=1 Tax=Cryptomonas curvata TaxID=233186 RepID=A0A7S0MDF9_9CRYP
MELIHSRKAFTSEENRCLNASMSMLFLLIACVTGVTQFSQAGDRWNQHSIHLSQSDFMYTEAAKRPSVSVPAESVTPLVGKNQFILPDISPGTARNIPSWNQLIGLPPGNSIASRKLSRKSRPRSPGLAPRKDAGNELVSESSVPKSEHIPAISTVAPAIQRQSRRTISSSLFSGLLSNVDPDESSGLRFPFNNCFALSLHRRDIKNCVQIEYSLSSRRLVMQNRDLLDRLQMKRLEIRALSREISGAATQLKYEENLFSSERHDTAAPSDPTATDIKNQHELLKWLKKSDGRSDYLASENHEIRDNESGVTGNAKPYTFSNLWNFLQTMVRRDGRFSRPKNTAGVGTKEQMDTTDFKLRTKLHLLAERKTAASDQSNQTSRGASKSGKKLEVDSEITASATPLNEAARRVAQAMSAVAVAKRLQLSPSLRDTGPELPRLPALLP